MRATFGKRTVHAQGSGGTHRRDGTARPAWPRSLALKLLAVAVVAATMSTAAQVAEAPPAAAHHNSDTFVTGTFRYADTNPDTGAVTMRPIAHAKVEIWRYAPRGWWWAWGHDATTTTDANGVLRIHMPYQNGIVYGVKVFATNYAAVVWPNDVAHTVPFHHEPGQPDGRIINLTATAPGQQLDFSYDFRDSWSPQHYNLAETARRGFDFVAARRDPAETDPIKPADVQPTSATNSWYNPTADTIVITSGDVFADLLILHEYAHFLEEQISSFAWIASNHDGCTARDAQGNVINSAEHAWLEAFADWFAQAVNRYLPTGLLTGHGRLGSTPSAATLEAPGACGFSGDTVENFVAASLYDLTDQAGDPSTSFEAFDRVTRLDRQIVQIFDRELDVYGVWPTVWHFRNAWRNRQLSSNALDHVLAGNRIPVARPAAAPTQGLGYDGDGKADTTVWRPSDGRWYVFHSATGGTTSRQWGQSGDVPVPGDYDRDGKLDNAVWRSSNGTWYIINSSTGAAWTRQWGQPGDVPVAADFDGDGRADTAIWRPSTGVWWVVNSTNGAAWTRQWGFSGDVPQAADFDGDGRDDTAVWRPSNGVWYVVNSTNGATWSRQWGVNGDTPQAADFDGDGRDDTAVWRPSDGVWWVVNSTNGAAWTRQWGVNGDKPQAADFDGDGRDDTAVWRPSNGTWYVVNSTNGATWTRQWGLNGDVPAART